MSKTLIIAEKPSVGRDLAGALGGKFEKHDGYLESDETVVTWAVGHLVELQEPEDYDERFKKWRMADLPIVPPKFKLVVRDERSRKQMSVITRMLKRDDVDEVINACDAGREGELIFAWTFEKAGAKKPVRRLWLSSMTSKAIKEAFAALRPASEFDLLEQAARSGQVSPAFHCGSVLQPIAVMEQEHRSAGRLLQRIRELTNNYLPPEDACNSWRAVWSGLAALEQDLHLHIHKENNILFPRAVELEATDAQTQGRGSRVDGRARAC